MSTTNAETGLPTGWEIRHSNSKNLPYYFNRTTSESKWEPPAGSNEEKLKNYMATHQTSLPNSLQPPSASDSPSKIRASHLLLKHRDSRRPASWKQDPITRTRQEAIDQIKVYEQQIQSGEVTLGELASRESDCSSARKMGDLGFFTKGQMQREFEDAAFALKPGEISGVVETASGIHLIERIA